MVAQRAGQIPRVFRDVRFQPFFRLPSFLSPTFCSVSTLRSAIELKAVFDQIQQAEQSGNLSAEEKKRLEEQAAEKGLQALFKVRLCPLPCPSPVHRDVGRLTRERRISGYEAGDRLGVARDLRPGAERPGNIAQHGGPARSRAADPRGRVRRRPERSR